MIEHADIQIVINPTGIFPNVTDEEAINACGMLPLWAVNPEYFDQPIKEAMDKQYQFGLYEMTGGKVQDDGIYSYPEDPDLPPIIKIKRGTETVYQYQYGIVAFVQENGDSFVCRMD